MSNIAVTTKYFKSLNGYIGSREIETLIKALNPHCPNQRKLQLKSAIENTLSVLIQSAVLKTKMLQEHAQTEKVLNVTLAFEENKPIHLEKKSSPMEMKIMDLWKNCFWIQEDLSMVGKAIYSLLNLYTFVATSGDLAKLLEVEISDVDKAMELPRDFYGPLEADNQAGSSLFGQLIPFVCLKTSPFYKAVEEAANWGVLEHRSDIIEAFEKVVS